VQVRQISSDEHLSYIAGRSSVSFLQTPAWGRTKAGWTSQSLGWFADDELVGAGLILLRKVPKVEKYLAYLPEGPDLNWENSNDVERALNALIVFAKARGVFQIKMGPHTWVRRWHADTLKSAIAEEVAKVIGEVPPDEVNEAGITLLSQLAKLGWKQRKAEASGFGDYQPRYVFQIDLAGKTEDQLFEGFNQQWRRFSLKLARE